MARLGADVDELDALGRACSSSACRLGRTAGTLTTAIGEAVFDVSELGLESSRTCTLRGRRRASMSGVDHDPGGPR